MLGRFNKKDKNQLSDVLVFRFYENNTGTISVVYSDWIKGHNYLLERPWLNNAPNISCILAGKYPVKWTFSPRFQRYTWNILKVPKRSGIRVHSGNNYKESLGCPLTGLRTGRNKNGDLAVWNSRSSLEDNWEYLVDREKPSNLWFNIIIKDLFPFKGT